MFSSRIIPFTNKVWHRLAAGMLVIWLIVINLSAWPHYLSYFNEIVGGSDKGWKYLRDSNIDWGQDLPALANYLREHKIDKIVLEYSGQADPLEYHISYSAFQPDDYKRPGNKFYVVSVQYLENVKWAKNYEPTATAGRSIFIYDLRK
jgi:hypothetical protein